VVKKENKAFCIISNDLFIFFPHSSTLACDIKGLRVEFYFSRDVASGEKYEVPKKGGGNKDRFWTNIYTPGRRSKVRGLAHRKHWYHARQSLETGGLIFSVALEGLYYRSNVS
jgi:hypothetical protein